MLCPHLSVLIGREGWHCEIFVNKDLFANVRGERPILGKSRVLRPHGFDQFVW